MAEFTNAKESLFMSMATPSSSSLSTVTGSSSSAPAIDDDYEDACSICLEPFSLDDPASVTNCKHEYHLHCILEWYQRSKECPICWQPFALKDPASQELLAAAGVERNSRTRRLSTNRTTYSHHFQEFDAEYGSQWTDDSDFNERMMQHLAVMMNQARQAQRNGRHGRSPSPDFMFPSRLSESTLHPNSPEECSSANGSSRGSSPIASSSHPPLSASPSVVNVSPGSAPRRVVHQPSRPIQSQSPNCTQRPRSSELLAFSESIKSKFSAASARYKDSISKGTQGFKEKLLARNSSVKELSKGVHREMTSSLAGVARMIERLDLKTKRNTQSAEVPTHGGETSNLFSKGKGVLDHIIATSQENHVVPDGELNLHEKSKATSSISSHKDVSCAERGN